jgi:DNA-binding beta-propeller fold protein YncE
VSDIDGIGGTSTGEGPGLTPDGDDDLYYEETVVEYRDNRRTRRLLAAALAVLVLLMAGMGYFIVRTARPVGAPQAADLPAGITWIRSIYAWGTSADQMLTVPTDVAFGADGTVWTLAGKHVIAGFTPDGQPRRVIRPPVGRGAGQVTSLEGIAVAEDGTIYVTDFGRNMVMVFSQEGAFLREWGVQSPLSVDVRGERVAISAANGIALCETDGKLIAKWGGRGPEPGKVDLPHGIVIGSDGNVYVADTQNRRVQAFDSSGRVLWTKGVGRSTSLSSQEATATEGGVLQSIQLPAGIAEDAAGRLLVADAFEFKVLVLDPKRQGLLVGSYGEMGSEDGQFAYPTGVAFDPVRDVVAVADTTNNRVQIIRLPGTGGSAVRRAVATATDSPTWLCLIPVILLVIAALLWLRERRRAGGLTGPDASSGEAP